MHFSDVLVRVCCDKICVSAFLADKYVLRAIRERVYGMARNIRIVIYFVGIRFTAQLPYVSFNMLYHVIRNPSKCSNAQKSSHFKLGECFMEFYPSIFNDCLSPISRPLQLHILPRHIDRKEVMDMLDGKPAHMHREIPKCKTSLTFYGLHSDKGFLVGVLSKKGYAHIWL